MRRYEFKCPNCGNDEYQKDYNHVEVSSFGNHAYVDGAFRDLTLDDLRYGLDFTNDEVFFEGAQTLGFFCVKCEHRFDATDDAEMTKWIIENCEWKEAQ